MSLPIAIQMYSVRDDAEKDFRGTAHQIKSMGYDGVELAGLYGHTAVEIKAILDEEKLTLVSAHISADDLEKDEVLHDYVAAGLTYAVIPWMQVTPDESSVSACVTRIRAVGIRCRDAGLQLLYHNHDFEFEKLDGEYILDRYYREVSPTLLQTELDTCWVNVGGEDPAVYLKKYRGRAPVVHLKDFAGKKSARPYGLIGGQAAATDTGEFEFRPLGSGLQNMPSVLQAAEDAGAQWLVVEQDMPSMGLTPLQCAEKSIQYLKEIYIH